MKISTIYPQWYSLLIKGSLFCFFDRTPGVHSVIMSSLLIYFPTPLLGWLASHTRFHTPFCLTSVSFCNSLWTWGSLLNGWGWTLSQRRGLLHLGMQVDTIWERVFPSDSCLTRFLKSTSAMFWTTSGPHDITGMLCGTWKAQDVLTPLAVEAPLVPISGCTRFPNPLFKGGQKSIRWVDGGGQFDFWSPASGAPSVSFSIQMNQRLAGRYIYKSLWQWRMVMPGSICT